MCCKAMQLRIKYKQSIKDKYHNKHLKMLSRKCPLIGLIFTDFNEHFMELCVVKKLLLQYLIQYINVLELFSQRCITVLFLYNSYVDSEIVRNTRTMKKR